MSRLLYQLSYTALHDCAAMPTENITVHIAAVMEPLYGIEP